MWQDSVILCLNMGFGLTLAPQIWDLITKGHHMNVITGTATVAMLIILGITYATLFLWLAVCGDAIDIGAWTLVLALSIRNMRRRR